MKSVESYISGGNKVYQPLNAQATKNVKIEPRWNFPFFSLPRWKFFIPPGPWTGVSQWSLRQGRISSPLQESLSSPWDRGVSFVLKTGTLSETGDFQLSWYMGVSFVLETGEFQLFLRQGSFSCPSDRGVSMLLETGESQLFLRRESFICLWDRGISTEYGES